MTKICNYCHTGACHPLLFGIAFVLIALFSACSTEEAAESASAEPASLFVQPLLDPVPVDSMGITLIHEHFFLDWTPAKHIDSSTWNNDAAFEAILPHLLDARARGVRTILECTPAYLGRNPELLQRLSESSGIRLLTNTGYYGARQDVHLPAHAFTETAEQLATRWISEYENGINSTRVKPGFIKIGVDDGEILSDVDAKLVRAAARTHLATGLTIVAHTGPDTPALQEVSILEAEGVAPEAWVWTHAQNGSPETHIALAQKGAWISLDGMGYITPEEGDSSKLYQYLDMLSNLKENKLLHRALISHDAGWYTHGEPGGGNYTPYSVIFDLVLPELKKRGFTDENIRQLLVKNPQSAYAVQVRKKKSS